MENHTWEEASETKIRQDLIEMCFYGDNFDDGVALNGRQDWNEVNDNSSGIMSQEMERRSVSDS